MVVETIKLVQTALAIWGLFGLDRDIDGLFCDETKVGVAKWRELMGMDKGEAYKLEVISHFPLSTPTPLCQISGWEDDGSSELTRTGGNVGRMYRAQDACRSAQLDHDRHVRAQCARDRPAQRPLSASQAVSLPLGRFWRDGRKSSVSSLFHLGFIIGGYPD